MRSTPFGHLHFATDFLNEPEVSQTNHVGELGQHCAVQVGVAGYLIMMLLFCAFLVTLGGLTLPARPWF